MFVSDYSKSSTSNESNIPIPKRDTFKRSTKRINKLPQIQKYIETIVKASSDYGCDRRNKVAGAKKNANLPAKGVENKNRHEAVKQNENTHEAIKQNENAHEAVKQNDIMSNEKSKNETETSLLTEKSKSEEDNAVLSGEIEKCLQRLYPNPYNLGKVNEFRDKKTRESPAKEMGEDSLIITADIQIKKDDKGYCGPQTDNLVLSLSFKDSEDDKMSDSSSWGGSTVWLKNLDTDKSETEIDNKTLYQPNELDDLRRIYDMMDKATESFRVLSNRSLKASENAKKNNKLVQFLSDESVNSTKNGSDDKEENTEKAIRTKRVEPGNENISESRSSLKDNCRRSVSADVVPKIDEESDAELIQTTQKIDEVLDFMYSCLLKVKEDDQKSTTRNVSTSIAIAPAESVGDVNTFNREGPLNELPTVESQNELGGYAETVAVDEEQRTPRHVLPLSAKIRKRKDDSYEVIKKALEAEEKLLAQIPRKEVFPSAVLGCQVGLQSFLEIPKRSFVICVNSLPRSLRTMNTSNTALSSLSISLSDSTNCWLTYPKHQREELCIAQTPSQQVRILKYRLEDECLLTTTTTLLESSMYFSKLLNRTRKHVEMSVQWVATPEAYTKPVHALREAIEETEECLYLLEQSSLSGASAEDNPKDNDKKRVHDLLLRTYNLQTRLRDYLQRMNCDVPSTARPQTADKGVSCEDDIDTVRDSLVCWFLDSCSQNDVKLDDAKYRQVKVGDRWCQTEHDDDRKSVNSFKSSNDLSENESKLDVLGQSKKVLKLNEIEVYKKSDDENKSLVVEYTGDPKLPAEALKTVFKGKDSSTELTIGLKDIPMSLVSNISVEKKKYSENHTKISICIAKESESFYLDDPKPSISQLEDEPESDDDFKSVTSTLSNSESKSDPKEQPQQQQQQQQKPQQQQQPESKKPLKHRFDFYQKMNTDNKDKSTGQTVCQFKALEPLKQALTDMQVKMRSIKKNSYYNSHEYYKRALKLAKMSAGYCQSCGNRAFMPEDTFGSYKSSLPRRYSNHRNCYFSGLPNSSFCTFRASGADFSDQYCDLSSPYSYSSQPRTSRSFLKSSLHDMPVIFGKI